MSQARLTRFDDDAPPDVRRAFGQDLLATLDHLGVAPGAEFVVTRAEPADANALGRFAAGSETSRKAAIDNYPRSGSQRHRVLLALIDAGERGATSDELHVRLQIPLASVKPRLIELREGGFANQNGKTRTSLTGSHVDVYVATGLNARPDWHPAPSQPPAPPTDPDESRLW